MSRADRQFRDERRRRLAAVAAVARGQSEAVPRPVRRRLDAGEDAEAAGGAAGRRNADLPDRLRTARRPRPFRPRGGRARRAAARSSSRSAATPLPPSPSRRCRRCRALWRRPRAGRPLRPRDLHRAAVLGDHREGHCRGRRCGRLVVFGIKPTPARDRLSATSRLPAAGDGTCSTSRVSSRSPISRPRSPIWRPAISTGTPASSCSAPAPCATPSRSSARKSGRRRRRRIEGGDRGGFRPLSCRSTSTRQIPSTSIDYAIMERARGIAMVPGRLPLERPRLVAVAARISPSDEDGNVIVGDVVAIDCENSYLRSDGRLLSAIGMKDVAVVSTAGRHLRRAGQPQPERQEDRRAAGKERPAGNQVHAGGRPRHGQRRLAASASATGCSRKRCRCGRTAGVDERAWRLPSRRWRSTAAPLMKPKRMRTMARQVYAFAVAKARGWDGPADG